LRKAKFLRVTERIGERHTAEFITQGSVPCQRSSETTRLGGKRQLQWSLFVRMGALETGSSSLRSDWPMTRTALAAVAQPLPSFARANMRRQADREVRKARVQSQLVPAAELFGLRSRRSPRRLSQWTHHRC